VASLECSVTMTDEW